MPGRLIVQVFLTAARMRMNWATGMRGVRSDVFDEALAPEEETPRWRAALTALEAQIRVRAWKRFDLRVFVGDESVRYSLLPALDMRLGPEELSRLAQGILLRTYGNAAQEWTVRLSAAGRNAVIAAAIDRELLEELQKIAAASEGRLSSVCPAFLQLAGVSGAFSSRTDTWLLALEPCATVIGLWEGANLRALRVRRSGGNPEELGAWLERERLRADSEVRNVVVCGALPGNIEWPSGWTRRQSPRLETLLQPTMAALPKPTPAVAT